MAKFKRKLYGLLFHANTIVPNTSSVGATISPLQFFGLSLSTMVLIIIAVYVVFLSSFMFRQQPENITFSHMIDSAVGHLADSSFSNRLKLLQFNEQQNQSSKSFVKDMSQMVLLNLLLPILTAILGYVFATKQDGNKA